MILATSPWDFSELWGGGVPASDIDHYGLRLYFLLLCTLIESAPPSPSAIQCTIFPAVFFHPASTQDHLPTRASPVSVLAYRENPVTLPSLTCYPHSPTLPLLLCTIHACQIPLAGAPILLPKPLLSGYPAAVPQPYDATTDCATSHLPCIQSPWHRTRILALGSPTPLSLPASYWCVTKEVCSLPYWSPYPPHHFPKSHTPILLAFIPVR